MTPGEFSRVARKVAGPLSKYMGIADLEHVFLAQCKSGALKPAAFPGAMDGVVARCFDGGGLSSLSLSSQRSRQEWTMASCLASLNVVAFLAARGGRHMAVGPDRSRGSEKRKNQDEGDGRW